MEDSTMIFFMGLSGSGKDTQAGLVRAVLEKKYGAESVIWLSTGNILRGIVQSGTYAGKMIDEKIMKAGYIAPPFLATILWAEKAVKEYKPGKHIILPSSPRTLEEAKNLDYFGEFFGIPKVFPIFLNVEREEVFERLKKRGRADDTDETINNRLDYFEIHVRPAVEYFRSQSRNKLIEINGNPRDPQKIHRDILKTLGLK